jgi:hypothetical protein
MKVLANTPVPICHDVEEELINGNPNTGAKSRLIQGVG